MYFTYRDEGRAFQALGIWSSGGVTVTGVSEPEQVRSLHVTQGVLEALAVPPLLGRWFSREDDTPGTPETVLLTHGYWHRRFGGDPSVIGRTISIDATPRSVIGVMPAGFKFLDLNAELILPQRFDRSRTFLGNFSFTGIARLKTGVTVQQASADVARMLPIWLNAWPAPLGGDRAVFANARIAPVASSRASREPINCRWSHFHPANTHRGCPASGPNLQRPSGHSGGNSRCHLGGLREFVEGFNANDPIVAEDKV
jgi:hypothetical protein